MCDLDIKQTETGIVFKVKIVPGSSKTAIAGHLDRMLKIKIAAPPEKGKANNCLIDFLASRLNVKKNAVTIISGHTNPIKQIRISGVSVENVSTKPGFSPLEIDRK